MLSVAVVGRPVDLTEMESITFDIYKATRRKVEDAQGLRILKSHEPFTPGYGRIVYLVRDPRDVALSYLNYKWDVSAGSDGTAAESAFVDRFVQGDIDSFGSWREHVISWLTTRGASADFLTVSYEEMISDTSGVMTRILDHMELTPQMPVEDIVLLASRERLLALELANDQAWRRSVGLKRTTFVGGAANSERFVDALDREYEDRILAEFADAMRLVGYS